MRKAATGDGVVNLNAPAEASAPAAGGVSAARPAKPPCARCGRAIGRSWAHWPEGYLFATCRTHALEAYGPCAGCGASRLTPGIAPDGGRLCTGCAGGLGDFTGPSWRRSPQRSAR